VHGHHGEGAAIRIGPAPCVVTREAVGEVSAGELEERSRASVKHWRRLAAPAEAKGARPGTTTTVSVCKKRLVRPSSFGRLEVGRRPDGGNSNTRKGVLSRVILRADGSKCTATNGMAAALLGSFAVRHVVLASRGS